MCAQPTIASTTGHTTQDAMASWDTARRQMFNQTLAQRAASNRAVLLGSAHKVLEAARSRRFISQGQYAKAFETLPRFDLWRAHEGTGRTREDLASVIEERAKDIINQMPSLKEALRVMAPQLLKPLAEKEKLNAAAQRLYDAYAAKSRPLKMSELDQSMTLAQFRALVVKTEKERDALLKRLNDVSEKLHAIEKTVAEALVKGVPQLSDEIVAAAQQQAKRAEELLVMSRRVGEQVMFGDSKAAQDILKEYEADEKKVSEDFKATFAAALEKLKLGKGRGRKVLRG